MARRIAYSLSWFKGVPHPYTRVVSEDVVGFSAMRRVTVLLALLLCPTSLLPQSDQAFITVGMYFPSMQKFLDAPDSVRLVYSAGFLEGLGVASVLGAPNEIMGLLHSCTKAMTPAQVSARFTKYGKDNPAVWHQPFGVHAIGALSDTCPQLKAGLKKIVTPDPKTRVPAK
jgi:hypothetical protein